MAKNLISSSFSIGAQKDTVSIDHIENYYLTEATGSTPSVSDSRWRKIADGATVPVPTSSAPFLWHKYIVVLTDGSKQDPIIEFKGSLGKNGIDYDLVPSHTSIVRHEDGSLSPTSVTCAMIMRNADGSAQQLSSLPAGYSIAVMRDAASQNYTLGSGVSTNDINAISFILKYGNIEVERHDIRVITEGAQGIAGRGIQSQDIRFKALASLSTPTTPENDSEWNTWLTLADAGYSAAKPYLYKCVKTVFVDGNNATSTEYYVEGPTVWGQDGKTSFVVDIDNEMVAIPVSVSGVVESQQVFDFHVRAFYGTDAVINNCEVAKPKSIPNGVSVDTFTKDNPKITIAKNTSISDIIELSFKVTHASYGSRDVVFSITPVKAGGEGKAAVIYQLLPSPTEVSVARTDNGDYNPSKVSLQCGYTKRIGNAAATSVADVTDAFDGYNIYFRRYNRTSQMWQSTYYRYSVYKHLLINLAVATYSKVEFVISTDTASSVTALTGVIDREIVPVIADGLNGSSPFTLVLSNDMASVALTNSGVVDVDFSESFSLKGFYGSSSVNISSASVEISPANSNIKVNTDSLDSIKVSVQNGYALSERTEIRFTVQHDIYGTRTITHTLAGIRAGAPGTGSTVYDIMPDLSQISFSRDSNNNLMPSSRSVNVNIKKVVGEMVSVLSVSASGLNVRYSFSSMPETRYQGTAVSNAITVASSTSYSTLFLAAFDGAGRLVDRQTIPILKDGARGGTGDSGNGIDSVAYYRMLTMSFEAPASNDSGWRSRDTYSESDLSTENRYLWEKKVTSYTKTSDKDSEVYLVSQFNAGTCPNLLEDTAFLSDNDMDAWEECHGNHVSTQNTNLPQNGWGYTPDWESQYQEMLKQQVRNGSNIRKVKPNTWYTLSFYAAMEQWSYIYNGGQVYNGYNSSQYYEISACKRSFYIAAGQTVKVRFYGRIENSSEAFMRVFAWLDSLDGSQTWLYNVAEKVTATYNKWTELSITNNQSSACLCRCCAYMYQNDSNETAVSSSDTKYRGYISYIQIDRGHILTTYLYREGMSTNSIQHSASAPWYVDGKKITSATTLKDGTCVSFGADGCVRWKLSSGAKRHSVTFKTDSYFYASDILRVLFRMLNDANVGWVSMPKLEENTMATEWMENANDRFASDFQHIYVGEWKPSTSGKPDTYYLYALGVRHCVRAKESASGSMTYFRLKERTATTGYCSLTEPYADSAHWEKANYLKFVAADLLLADEVITDKLTVSKIRAANDHFTIDGEGNVTANGGTFKNINVLSGDENGQRVEIDPDSKNVAIFDKNNNQCTSIDGNVYTLNDLIPNSDNNSFTLNSEANHSRHDSVIIAGGLNSETLLSNTVYMDKPAKLKLSYSDVRLAFTFNTSDANVSRGVFVSVQLHFVVKAYSDAACKNLKSTNITQVLGFSVKAGETKDSLRGRSGNVTMSVGTGYLRLYAAIKISSSGTTNICPLDSWWNVSSAQFVVDSFISRYFSNGMALSKNNQNYIALYEENGYMNVAAASDGQVLTIYRGQLAVNGANQPITVYAARVTDDSKTNTERAIVPTVFSQIESGVTVKHLSAIGQYRVTVPSSFGLKVANTLVRATGYGHAAGASSPIKATVSYILQSNGQLLIDIIMSDDDSPNNGGFFIEIVKY